MLRKRSEDDKVWRESRHLMCVARKMSATGRSGNRSEMEYQSAAGGDTQARIDE